MLIAASRRGGGRSWLAVLLASLVALVVAAVLLLDGGGRSAPAGALLPPGAGPATPSLDPSAGATPAPPRRAPATPSGDRDGPLWPGRAATPAAKPQQPPAPQRLLVPRLDLDLAVVPTGVTGDGQMELPERPTEVGWYRWGPRPGSATGSAVLAGHVDSREFGIGPLAELDRLRAGDRIEVQTQGGQQPYEVRQVVRIDKRSVPLDQVFSRTGPASLRIVTCGGPYDRSRGGYLDNLVVTAEPLWRTGSAG